MNSTKSLVTADGRDGMILLKDCYSIYTQDADTPLSKYDILLYDNRIEKIARNIRSVDYVNYREGKLQVIDCSHLVVVPGFINTHHHFYQTLTRNLPAVQNERLFHWLGYLYEVWKNIDEEAIFYSSLVAIGELLKTGCTCTTDHHYLYPRSFSGDLMAIQFEAADKLGIRFSPCRGSMSLSVKDGGLPPDTVVQTAGEIIRDSQRVIEKFHDKSDLAMKKVLLAPCSPFSVTEDLMKETVRLARDYGVRLHTHLAETADEDNYCMKHFNRRPLRLMMDTDFIGEDVSYAHGIFFNNDELRIIAETHTSIAHCPTSNMRLGSGIARVKEMLDMGINVSLGVDGSASNDTSDFLGELRNCMLLQRVKYGADALTTSDVYKIATERGAQLLNLKKVGKIKEGWAADLALFNINRLEYSGSLSDPPAALIFAGINHQTEYTIVNGRIVVERGKLVGFDEEDIIRNANRISSKLIGKNEKKESL